MTKTLTRLSARIVGPLIAAVAVVVATATSGGHAAAPTAPAVAASDPQQLQGKTLRTYPAFDADQGVAVDADYFYSVDNYSITKHDRKTGKALLQWYGGEDGPIIHLDGAMVLGHTLYAPHSNYPTYPETSSIETWDTRTMKHTGSIPLGIYRGSMTWIDRHDGHWWAAFANYDKIQDGQTEPYGKTDNTQLVEMDDHFQVIKAWIYPADLVDRFRPMSNSGGSWGPDGRLYITGHDNPEAYVIELPAAGSTVRWVATISLPDIAGQGIAWDRGRQTPTLWGISRDSRNVVRMTVPLQHGKPTAPPVGDVYGPGHFIEPS
jgi:hypothetical protein